MEKEYVIKGTTEVWTLDPPQVRVNAHYTVYTLQYTVYGNIYILYMYKVYIHTINSIKPYR